MLVRYTVAVPILPRVMLTILFTLTTATAFSEEGNHVVELSVPIGHNGTTKLLEILPLQDGPSEDWRNLSVRFTRPVPMLASLERWPTHEQQLSATS